MDASSDTKRTVQARVEEISGKAYHHSFSPGLHIYRRRVSKQSSERSRVRFLRASFDFLNISLNLELLSPCVSQ